MRERRPDAGEHRAARGGRFAYPAGLLESVEDAVIAVDADFVLTTWNPGAERLYGWRAHEVLGRDVGEFVRLDMTSEERREMRRRTLADGRTRRNVAAFRADGSKIQVELTTLAMRDAAGRLTGYLGIHRDVTERMRDEERLRYHASLLNNVDDGVIVTDAEFRITLWNPGAERLYGPAAKDVLGRPAREVASYPGDESRAVLERELRTTGRTRIEFAAVRTDGTPIEVELIAVAVPGADGEVAGYLGINRDVTARRREEAELRASQRQVTTILESVTDAFCALDHQLRFTYLNERAVRFLAELSGEPLTREDFLGREVFAMFPALVGTDAEKNCRAAVREQRAISAEYVYPPRQRWFDVDAYPGPHGLAVSFREITERKAAEADRERRAQQQAVVAQLGVDAAATDDVQGLLDEAVALVADALGVERAGVAEILADRERLVLRAGVGWTPGAVGHATSAAGRGSLVGYAVVAGAPVIAEDIRHDDRFSPSPFLIAEGSVSAAVVVIAGRDEPFGALGAFSAERRLFTEEDANFLRAVANVLYTAVERSRAARAVEDIRQTERRRIARALHDEAMQDLGYAVARATELSARAAAPDALLLSALTRVGRQLRGAIHDLRLGDERDRAFPDRLGDLIGLHRAMAAEGKIDVTLGDLPASPLGDLGTEVLRVLAEALTNARRHADAGHVGVRVSTSDGVLTAEVVDDGDGFDAGEVAATTRGAGLVGMRERAALLGGRLDVTTAPGRGTSVRLEVSLGDGEDRGEPVRVLVVEDHAAVRESLAAAFGREPDFEVVGEAASLEQGRGMLEGVDVAVIDLGLPDGDGDELIAGLREASPHAQALVLSGQLDRSSVARAVERGAAGALSKEAHLQEVVTTVRRLRAGETLIPLDEVVQLLGHARRERELERDDRATIATLTPREREILQLLAEGLNRQRAAARLHISPRTHRNHVANIIAKLGVHSQLQALVFALRYDLVDVGGPDR